MKSPVYSVTECRYDREVKIGKMIGHKCVAPVRCCRRRGVFVSEDGRCLIIKKVRPSTTLGRCVGVRQR